MCVPLKFRFQQVIRFGLYDDSLRHACIRAKATTQFPLAAALANQLWFSERSDLEATNVDVIAPVPCHWTRRLLRPHHAAETIARVLAKRLEKPLHRRLLLKQRLTADQSDLSAAQRRLNLKDAFAVSASRRSIVGKTVLLVDDILTTGTTANECTRTLLNAGAKRVFVAVIAVVP
jgi:ComF family protein